MRAIKNTTDKQKLESNRKLKYDGDNYNHDLVVSTYVYKGTQNKY